MPPRVVVVGPDGVGKTRFAASAPNVIMMPAEQGAATLDVDLLPQPTCYTDVMNMLAELSKGGHKYKTLAIDTIDRVEPLVWDAVCEGTKHNHIESWGYGKGYSFADPLWIDFFRALDVLMEQGMTIIVLCHSEEKMVDDPTVGSYLRSQPKLHKRAMALMKEWCDLIGFLQIERMPRDVGASGKKETRTSITTGQRLLHVSDNGAVVAKNRYDLEGPIMIPKVKPYQALRLELMKAMGLKTPTTKKEAA